LPVQAQDSRYWSEQFGTRSELLGGAVVGIPVSGPGSTLNARLTQELHSVLNFAVGYEYALHEAVTVYGSFLTDFSSATNDPDASHSFTLWDIYQLTGGAAFTFQKVDFTLGASLATGKGTYWTKEDVVLAQAFDPIEVKYRRIKAFVGFELGK
jgi:hypothetical protein